MNLKKTLLSSLATFALVASMVAGVAAQADQRTGVVNVTAGGEFNAYFCSGNEQAMVGDLNFQDATVNSSSGDVKVSGDLVVCYKDTKNNRKAFTSRLSATNFYNGTGGVIDKTNISLGFVSHVNSGQWASAKPGVGSIAGRHGNSESNSVSRPGQQYGSNNFGSSLLIAQGWAGIGTGSDFYLTQNHPVLGVPYQHDPRSSQGSWHELEVVVNVPQTTPGGKYQNTFTLTIAPANP